MHGDASGWRASNRYWRKSGNVLLVTAAATVPWAILSGVPWWHVAPISFGLALPAVLWMRRLAAWDNGESLVIRSWFTTKYLSWSDVDSLCLVARSSGGRPWLSAAARHGKRRTYLNSMAAVSSGGAAQLLSELDVVADRHGLTVEIPEMPTFSSKSEAVFGFRLWD